MNMGIWIVNTSNQLFIRGSNAETKFEKKKKNSYWQNSALPSVYFALLIPFFLTMDSDSAVFMEMLRFQS